MDASSGRLPTITQLFPARATRPLAGTYLAHALRDRGTPDAPFVYTNFIASLDGRIAYRDPHTGNYGIPRPIANALDWRLFLELATQADVVVTSARRLRELATKGKSLRCVPDLATRDLAEWRRAHDLTPFPACLVVSAGLDLPYDALRTLEHDDLIIVTTSEPTAAQRRALDSTGATLVRAAGDRVDGQALLGIAREREFRTMYSIGGPQVFHTLVTAGTMHRLYLTHAHRLLAGDDYDTALAGPSLVPPVALLLHELHYLEASSDAPQMLFGSYDINNVSAHAVAEKT